MADTNGNGSNGRNTRSAPRRRRRERLRKARTRRRALVVLVVAVVVGGAAAVAAASFTGVAAFRQSCDLDVAPAGRDRRELVRLRGRRLAPRRDPCREQSSAAASSTRCRPGSGRRRWRSRTAASTSTTGSTTKGSSERRSRTTRPRTSSRAARRSHSSSCGTSTGPSGPSRRCNERSGRPASR